MAKADKTNTIRWKMAERDVRKIASVLCARDSFFAAPDDEKRAREVLDGEIFYRQRMIKIADWQTPQNLEESLQSSWKFYYHSLVWLSPLRRENGLVPDDAYVAAYLGGVSAWLDAHGTPPDPLPTQQDPGDYTWYDMSTAWRTMIIIGAVSLVGADAYYLDHLATHAAVLANEDFYAGVGNHALHQNYALLSVALILDRNDYLQLASDRIAALREISIDDEGVALEGSASYHLFNLNWWSNMDHQLRAASGLIENARDLRVPDMRPFLHYAVAPDGKIVMLGDSTMTKGQYRNVINEYPDAFISHIESDPQLLYVLSRGQEGKPLTQTMAVFSDGYWFSRAATKDRAPAHQSHASMRFGAGLAERVHAHDDAGAVTFYPRGIRVLEDGGMFGYYGGDKREFVKSNHAHNTVLVEGRKYYRSAISDLVSATSHDAFDQAQVRVTAVEKTGWTRIAAHARDEDFLFLQDHVKTNGAPWRQIFNLGDGFEVVRMSRGRTDAANDKGDKVVLIWLDTETRAGLVRGGTDPLIGWRSTYEGELHPVACVTGDHDAPADGATEKSALVVLLLDPTETFADIALSNVQLRTGQTRFTLHRRGYDLVCNIALNTSEAASDLTRIPSGS